MITICLSAQYCEITIIILFILEKNDDRIDILNTLVLKGSEILNPSSNIKIRILGKILQNWHFAGCRNSDPSIYPKNQFEQ